MLQRIIGKEIISLETIDSTNDEAKRLIKKGLSEGTVIIAKQQSAGRGKPGSSWQSPLGGLYLSVIVKPYKNPNDLGEITMLGARAVVSTIEQISSFKPKIKLPNDVYLNNKKLCGILVERVATGEIIIGAGVNVNITIDQIPAELKDKATSLRLESGKNFTVKEFFETLLLKFNDEYLAYLKEI